MRYWLNIVLILFSVSVAVAQDFPERPSPPRLVNDFAGILNGQQREALEQDLVHFAQSTSVQIAVVTIQNLDGYEVSDYADRLAENWGIGTRQTDNGVLILIKPKIGNERGQVTIRVGYGLEPVIPDIVAKRTIIENEMIPRFRDDDYFGGLVNAVKVIQGLASKEFTAQQYMQSRDSGGEEVGAGLFILLMIIIFFFFRNSRRSYYSGKSSLPFWIAMGMLGSQRRSHPGAWGNFTSGGGSFGGGGFGGFGGGRFGGGGASGSW